MRVTMADLREAIAAAEAVDDLITEAAEFAAQHEADTGVVDFLDVLSGGAFDVAPERAIDFFRAKGLRRHSATPTCWAKRTTTPSRWQR